jgi:hypothetical protein
MTPTARFISNASLSFSLAGAIKRHKISEIISRFQTTNSTKQTASNHGTVAKLKTKNMSASSFKRSTHKYPVPTRSFAAEELPQTLHPCHKHITRLYTHPQIHSNRSRFFPPFFPPQKKVPPGLILGQLLSERACMIKKLREPVWDASIALT